MKPSRRLVRIAYHEAGHAVACLALGVRVVGIVVKDSAAFVAHQEAEGVDAIVILLAGPVAEGRHTGREYPWSSFTEAREAAARMIRRPVSAVAPPRRLGSAPCDGSDIVEATQTAATVNETNTARIHAWHVAQSRVRALVNDHWPDIAALAVAVLQSGGRMDHNELVAWWAGRPVQGTT